MFCVSLNEELNVNVIGGIAHNFLIYIFIYFLVAVDCGSIIVPQNGSKVGQETTYPYSIKFSCDEGFILLGSTIRNCLAIGTWSGTETLCKGNRNRTVSILQCV